MHDATMKCLARSIVDKSAGALPTRQLAHNMLLAAGKLTATNRSLFDRLFLRGEAEGSIASELKVTATELQSRKTSLLRALIAATSSEPEKVA